LKNKEKNIAIIGFGKLGSALYYELKSNGYTVNTIIEKNSVTYNKIKKITGSHKVFKSINACNFDKCDVLILSVKDSQLEQLVKEINEKGLNCKEKIILHTSGAKSSNILKIKGLFEKNRGSFHPIQTFNALSLNNQGLLSGIFIGIEGGKEFLKYSKGLIKSFNSNLILIKAKDKELYHLACVVSSNLLASYFSILEKIAAKAGISRDKILQVFKPIVYKTVENIFNFGTSKSLTGPFERGDTDTVKMHLSKIKREKVFKDLYLILGKEALDLASKKDSITLKQKKEIERILK
jgi:predicted short-subunit dehydrogenase-like oxidoreductase (DUF2520 family)